MESLHRCLRNPSACHPSVPWGSHSLGASLACKLMCDKCSWGILETSDRNTSGYTQSISVAWELLYFLQHHCIVCAMSHFLPPCTLWGNFYHIYKKLHLGNTFPSLPPWQSFPGPSMWAAGMLHGRMSCVRTPCEHSNPEYLLVIPCDVQCSGNSVVSLRNICQCVLLGIPEPFMSLPRAGL